MINGLYIVTNVATGLEDKAFQCVENSVNLDPQTIGKSRLIQGLSAYPALFESQEEAQSSDDEATKRSDKERYTLFHRRFAHLGPDKLRNLHKVTTLKEKIKIPQDRGICDVCSLAKLHNKIPKTLRDWNTELLGRVQFDIAGPFPRSIRKNRWFLLIKEISTRHDWVIPLKRKRNAIQALNTWKVEVELITGKQVKSVGCDNAPELLKTVQEWAEKHGVQLQSTTIASSHQNGPAERTIQTVEHDMRALLEDSGLPIELWDEAAEAECYIRNRTESLKKGVSPSEAFTGTKPSIDHIRIWGSKCYYYVDRKSIPANERKDKLVNTGRVGVLVGYSPTTTSHFKVYSPERGRTIIASVVKIDEAVKGGTVELRIRTPEGETQGTKNTTLDRKPRGRPKGTTKNKTPLQEAPLRKSTVQVVIPLMADKDRITSPAEKLIAKTKSRKRQRSLLPPVSPIPSNSTPSARQPPSPTVEDTPEEENQPTASTSTDPTATYTPDDSASTPTAEPQAQPDPPRYFTRGSTRKRAGTIVEEPDPKRARALIAQLLDQEGDVDLDELKAGLGESFETAFPAEVIAGVHIPRTYKEAVTDSKYGKKWRAAMAEEMLTLHANQTFKEVVTPDRANIVSCKWVYTIKTDNDNNIERFKARLVARGFSQVYGEDYNQTFAPTVRMDTLRIFLATVAAEDLQCSQFDIKNAFTESHLKETIYLQPPLGLDVKKGYVWQALRSLYGLKQAARDWNRLFKKELLGWGFVQSLADPCLFTHPDKSTKLLVYVDDIVASAKKQGEIDEFYKTLRARFNAKDLGEIKKILGARVTQDRKNRTLYLDQEQYLNSVLEKFGITKETAKTKRIPAADYESLRPANGTDKRINVTEYQQAIGSLMYAMIFTRPDIAFVLGKLSQFMSDPAEHHGYALKFLFRYLKSTVKQRIRYGPGGDHEYFVLYSDADWATDKVDRKSVSGSIAMFFGGPTSWSSKKQRSVATSSCESEYMALASCVKQGQWIAQILRDLGYAKYIGKNSNLVQMFGDNQGAIALTENAHLNDRSKHVDICYHYIRDLVENGRCRVDYIPTNDMVADGMTKPLQRVKFERFKEQMGLVNRKENGQEE
jgi:hypothetical protein